VFNAQTQSMATSVMRKYCTLTTILIISVNLAFGQSKKPNIIFVLTDDLGYGDVGVFWQNQRAKLGDRTKPWTSTPNLDKMAAEGAILTQAYAAAPVCAPSRSSLLSGLSQGHARVRDNQFDKDLADNHTLGNVLQKAGYATAAIGKWGLQGTNEWSAHPLNRGFDYYYGYMRHSDGHEHYPKEGLYRKPKEVWENRKEVSKDLDKSYTTDLWTAVAKKWIVDLQEKTNSKQPFFMYLAYDAPHAVLELPTGPYPAGGGLQGGVQWLGQPGHMINTAKGNIDSYTYPDYATAKYDNDHNPLTPEVPWPDTYKRYASSVRRIDEAIGDILKLLVDLKIDDNTLVIFSSDNGPSIESYLPKPQVDYAANFFGSTGPFDGIKRDELEGGMRMPVIVRWPGHVPAGRELRTPTISYDWLPTMTAAAGLPPPANADGRSILPALTGKGKQSDGIIYSEYFEGGRSPNYPEFSPDNRQKTRKQMQMVRVGNFVGLRYNVKTADDDVAIFDVVKDSRQSNNLAAKMPELAQRMKQMMLQVRRPDSSAKRPYDDALIPASSVKKVKPGIAWKAFNGNYPWLPEVSAMEAAAKGLSASPTSMTGHSIYLFEGYIKVPADGAYTFYLSSGEKALLRIHNATVIDEDYNYAPNTTKDAVIKLKAGYHPFKLYCSGKEKVVFDLKWKGPDFEKSKMATNVFYKKN